MDLKAPEIIVRKFVQFDSNGNRYQLARVGGRNPKINDIGVSLSDRGYILTEPMPVLFYNNDKSYNIITGMTRDYWLNEVAEEVRDDGELYWTMNWSYDE